MKKLIYLTILVLSVTLPSLAQAQIHDKKNPRNVLQNPLKNGQKPTTVKQEKKPAKAIDVNHREAVDSTDEYWGVLTDINNNPQDDGDELMEEVEEIEYQRPFIINPPANDDPTVEQPFLFQTSREDEGAESEDEILLAADSTMIHSPKLDISTLTEPVILQLTNPQRGEMFVFPTPELARATSHFGPRRRRFHYGVDLAMPTGEPIYAAFDGVVRLSKKNKSYGNLIVIRHGNGLETYYAHLSKRYVTPGTHVRAGDIIGLCGNTGRSYGSHLHFEVRYQGNALNPEDVMDCSSRKLVSPTLTLTKDSFRTVSKNGKNSAGKGSRQSDVGNYSGDGKYYKVRSGDTLSRIAQRNGTTVQRLCQLNNIKETTLLQIGQRIRLR